MTSEVEERPRLVTAGYGRHGSQWVTQLSSLQAISELMTSSNLYINIQLTKYISSCFDLRNILLSKQTNVIQLLLYDHDNCYCFGFSL